MGRVLATGGGARVRPEAGRGVRGFREPAGVEEWKGEWLKAGVAALRGPRRRPRSGPTLSRTSARTRVQSEGLHGATIDEE